MNEATGGEAHLKMGQFTITSRSGADGVVYIESEGVLDGLEQSLAHRVGHWADATPDRVMVADRGEDGHWRSVTYAEARNRIHKIAAGLVAAGLSVDRPLLILSGNDVEHMLLGLAAIYAGIPYSPVSPAYSLRTADFAKLRHIMGVLTPGMVYASEGAAFGKAIVAVIPDDVVVVTRHGAIQSRQTSSFDQLMSGSRPQRVLDELDTSHRAVSHETIAKFLFTSGSTGVPKAVITTNGMLMTNQEMLTRAYPFVKDQPPIMVDWMPWNHVAGGSNNVGLALYNGGTLYIDDGTPTPDGMARTVRNLIDVSPTVYFNVPKGYEMLAARLQDTPKLAQAFFRRMLLLQYAGATLSQHVWNILDRLSREVMGAPVMIVTGYGATETAPFAFTTTDRVDRPGVVGLPAPSLKVKLVPNGDKLELRLKGPSITPGYWRDQRNTAQAFDDEGYYMMGDALKFIDASDISKGFLFDGRVGEDFKLSTGTWVSFSGVRSSIIAACAPLVRDVVLTGLNRDHIGALLYADVESCIKFAELPPGTTLAEITQTKLVREAVQAALDALATQSTGSSTYAARAILVEHPPAQDLGEITDKGSLNQRLIVSNNQDLVNALYDEGRPDHVLVARRHQTGKALRHADR